MLRHQQQALGKIEHLALLDRDRRLRIERQTAMPAYARLMRNHEIGLGDLPQRVAHVALLAAALLAGLAAQTAGRPRLLLQPVARRRLRAVRAVQPQAAQKLGHHGLELRDPAVLRSHQLLDFGRDDHPASDSDSSHAVAENPPAQPLSAKLWQFGLTPAWELQSCVTPKPGEPDVSRWGRRWL